MRLPLLPTPYLDETFGSWLSRAAAEYHSEVDHFARAVLRLEGKALPREFDFDTNPPESLVTALARHSPLKQSELEYMVAKRTAATLPVGLRDAYCPLCLREDRARGVIYRRRALLDAWVMTCDRHGCALGCLEQIEYRPVPSTGRFDIFPSPPEPCRLNPWVRGVKLPTLMGISAPFDAAWQEILRKMLTRRAGRDLLLFVGSDAADMWYYDLTGMARTWKCVWHDANHVPRRRPEIEHPIAGIGARISAAYLACFVWHHLRRAGSVGHLTDRAQTLDGMREDLKPLMSRWSREDRSLFAGIPSSATAS